MVGRLDIQLHRLLDQSWQVGVLIINCCVTNNPQTGLKHHLLSRSFCGWGIQPWCSWVLSASHEADWGGTCFQARSQRQSFSETHLLPPELRVFHMGHWKHKLCPALCEMRTLPPAASPGSSHRLGKSTSLRVSVCWLERKPLQGWGSSVWCSLLRELWLPGHHKHTI